MLKEFERNQYPSSILLSIDDMDESFRLLKFLLSLL